MNPISSLPPMAMPGLQPMPKVMPKGLSPQPIPFNDLRELPTPIPIGQSRATPTLDQVRSGTGSFDTTVGRLVGEVNQKQSQAAATVRGLFTGENVQLHQAVLAMEEASISFQLMVEVRNKMLESYQELMRMQI